MKNFLLLSLSVLLFSIPVFVFAVATINANLPGMAPATAGTPPGSFIAGFYSFALMIGGVLAFGAVVWGGILYAASAGNPGKQSEGRDWIKSALLGLLLLAGAYLILHTINPSLVNLGMPTNLAAVNVTAPAGQTGTGPTGNNSANCQSLAATGGSTVAAEIDAAAVGNCGASSANGPGTNGGQLACAYEVNQVLAAAGIAPLDSNSVQAMENALTGGRGTLITDQSTAQPGDIVIQGGDGHVGICMNVGCTQVLSNSSSNASFTWVSNNTFSPSYSGAPGSSRIYSVNG